MDLSKPVSVALLNVLNPNPYRVFRDEYFPYIVAYLRQAGVPVCRYFLGAEPAGEEGGPSGLTYTFSSEDLDSLVSVLERLQPTHILLNERLGSVTFATLKAACPAASFRLVEVMGHNDVYSCVTEWLGMPWASGMDVRVETWLSPDYGGEVVGASAREARPHIHLLAGSECAYRRPISGNRHYQRVDLSGVLSRAGCSFCGTGGTESWVPRDPLALVGRQLRQAYATGSSDVFDWTFRVRGSALVGLLPEVACLLRELDAPPSRFLLSVRIDEFLAASSSLQQALPILREAGHRVDVWNMGVENFSEVENERLNKGIDLGMMRRIVPLLTQFQQQYPDTFGFRAFGFILFTPWTTLNDLTANVDAIEELQLNCLEHFLSSTLLLLPGRAITELARRDGLLLQEGDTRGLNLGCLVFWDSSVIPWKFLHPEVAAIHEVMLRACPPEGIPCDAEWCQDVQRWVGRLWPPHVPGTKILRALVDAARQGAGTDAESLMRHVESQLTAGGGVVCAEADPGPWRTLLQILKGKPKAPLLDRGAWRLEGWRRPTTEAEESLELELLLKGVRVDVVLEPVGRGGGLARGRRWSVWYKEPKGELSPEAQLALRRLLVLAEKFVRVS